jgi:hypothetical protein
MRRLVALGPGVALLLSLPLAPRARAAHRLAPPAAPATGLRVSRGPVALPPGLLRLTPSREFGLAGVNLRLRLPAPVSPYVEGRLGDGLSASRPDGALVIPGTAIALNGAAGERGAGVMAVRGVDLGLDVLRFRGGYVSVAVGWLRESRLTGGLDLHEQLVARSVSLDSAMFKVAIAF